MLTPVYLDTARLGQMCPEAQAADRDFVRLAGEEGCSLYFEDFLHGGYFGGLSPRRRRRFPNLSGWEGLATLKRDLSTLLSLSPGWKVLLANRSAQLVELAARLLCKCCHNILVTDMAWPAYRDILHRECRRTGRLITTAPVRKAVLRDKISKAELINLLVGCYRNHDCDGLLLSAVTFDGLRMPVREVYRRIDPFHKPRFAVVDGAQAVNHAPLALYTEYCDFLVGGCHKWLRAYHPMGLGCCCRTRTQALITSEYRRMLEDRSLDDPLLRFTEQLESHSLERFSETVNLAPMFTATAATSWALRCLRIRNAEFAAQLENADALAEQASGSGWRPVRPDSALRTGILLLQAQRPATRSANVNALRAAFRRAGVALTAYANGIIRTSLLGNPLSSAQRDCIRAALCQCA